MTRPLLLATPPGYAVVVMVLANTPLPTIVAFCSVVLPVTCKLPLTVALLLVRARMGAEGLVFVEQSMLKASGC